MTPFYSSADNVSCTDIGIKNGRFSSFSGAHSKSVKDTKLGAILDERACSVGGSCERKTTLTSQNEQSRLSTYSNSVVDVNLYSFGTTVLRIERRNSRLLIVIVFEGIQVS